MRRSSDRAGQRSPLHPVSAWAEEQRLVLGQLAVDAKSNATTALPKLLEMLTLRGAEPEGHCAENLSLHLARLEASKDPMRGKLQRAGGDDSFLISALSQFTKIHMR